MKWLVLITLLIGPVCFAKQLRVAIIDTGYSGDTMRLCKTGHYDFIEGTATVGRDQRGHGTDIVKTIEQYSGTVTDYCFLIYKVFGNGKTDSFALSKATLEALKQGADVLNLSYNGPGASDEEHEALRKAVRSNAIVFVAAGNEGLNLDIKCNSYPACYRVPGVLVVGAVDDKAKRHGNYGSVIDEDEPFCRDEFCGTSASTAIATGKYLKDRDN